MTERGQRRTSNKRGAAPGGSAADEALREQELAALQQALAGVSRERDEAHEREQATAEVLRVISRSPEDLDTSLQAVADAAVRLCRASLARVFLRDGDDLVGGPNARADGAESDPGRGVRRSIREGGGAASISAREGRTVHIEDMAAYLNERGASEQGSQYWTDNAPRGGQRTTLAVPLLRAREVVGVILLIRLGEVQPFTAREIALAETFADQAVIAIENARLFEALRQRSREQAEALEREEATAEVLRVISRSPENLDASLQAVADTAARLCRADLARVMLRDGEYLVVGRVPPAHKIRSRSAAVEDRSTR